MYNVLVVDDEMLIRKRIIYGFKWEEMGYHIAAEAENGYDALDIIEHMPIDLAIIDISMPGINGIELIQRIRKRGYTFQIILLTGYSNFEYARDALKEGVFYYILKPLSENEFIEVLEKLTKKLEEIRDFKENKENVELFLKFKYISNLLHQEKYKDKIVKDRVEIEHRLKGYDICFTGDYYVSVFREEETSESNINELSALLERHVEKQIFHQMIYDIYDDYIILFYDASKIKNMDFAKEVYDKVTGLRRNRYYCGISGRREGLGELHQGYTQAIRALNNAVMMDMEILWYDEVVPGMANKYLISNVQKMELRQTIEAGDIQLASRCVLGIFSEMKAKRLEYAELVRILVWLISMLSEITAESKLEIKNYMGDYYSVEAAVLNMGKLETIQTWILMIINNIINSRKDLIKKGQKFELCQKTRQYIIDNYQNPELTLTAIAEYLNVTPAYISSAFKQGMSMSIMQYLTMVRLENAKELLCDIDDIDVREVAWSVGYSDEYYFSRCFKRYFGVSPSIVKKTKDKNLLK